MLNAAIQNDSNMTVLAKKMIVVVAKSRLGEVRIKKPTKPNSFHTSGSPRADPYPNFDATPGHCGWELLGVWLQ